MFGISIVQPLSLYRVCDWWLCAQITARLSYRQGYELTSALCDIFPCGIGLMTFFTDNQPHEKKKKITVQLYVKGEKGVKKLLWGSEWIRKGLFLNERFNQILTVDRIFYDLRIESKEARIFKGIRWMSAKMCNFAYWHIRHIWNNV